MQSPIDHERTAEITCPHCGVTHRDSWEYENDTGEINCECGTVFIFERIVEIAYTTRLKATTTEVCPYCKGVPPFRRGDGLIHYCAKCGGSGVVPRKDQG